MRNVKIERGGRNLSFCFFFEDRDLVRKGCLDHELISCSRASEKHRKKEQVFFVRIIEILQCLYRSLSKWCAYACSISVRDVCAMLNGVVSKAFREYGTQNHSSEYFLLFFIFLCFSHSPSLSLLTSSSSIRTRSRTHKPSCLDLTRYRRPRFRRSH